jgi:integrase
LWLEQVKGAKPSTVADYRFLIREPGVPHRRGAGASHGRIMAALGDLTAADVTTSEVSVFLRSLDSTGLTPRSINTHRQVLAAMFTYGSRSDTHALPFNPVTGTDKRRENPPAALDYYEVEEVEALARACENGEHRTVDPRIDAAEVAARRMEDHRDAEAFRLLFYTGLRLGELLPLRWEDVDLKERLLLVRRGLSAGQETLPKGRQHRFVPLSAPAAATLARLSDRDEFTSPASYVVCNRLGRRLDPSALRRRYKRACEAAGEAARSAPRLRQPRRPHDRRRLRARLPRPHEAVDDGPLRQRQAAPRGVRAPGRRIRSRERAGAGGRVTADEVVDPDGRRVVLDAAGWQHIVDEHGELAASRGALLAAVARPDHRGPDPRPGRERYWRRGFGPSRWLMVVVDFNAAPARVVTAFGNRRDPPGWTT